MKPANPYEAPKNVAKRKAARPRRSPLGGVIAVGFSGLILTVILISQSRYSRMFEELDIALPALTRVALSPALPVALTVLLVATILFEIAGGRWAANWRVLAVIVSLAAAAVYVLGVAQAFMSLVWSLS